MISGETNPLDPDSDNDTLSDGLESNTGTDPLNPDTDGDSLTDGSEDAAGIHVGIHSSAQDT